MPDNPTLTIVKLQDKSFLELHYGAYVAISDISEIRLGIDNSIILNISGEESNRTVDPLSECGRALFALFFGGQDEQD
jgi:hypothetical protein